MQPQSSKNNYNGPQNTGNNITAQNRANQTSAGINFRQNISNLTPRNRYVPATTMFPSVHPSVVMGQFNATYATRPPALQYAPQYYPHIYYPYYQQLTQQQQQPQSGGGNPLANLNTVMAVQPGGFVSGPIQAANRAAMPFTVPPGNSVLNVATNNTAQAVGISTIQQTTTPLTFNLTSVSATPMLAATTTTTAQPAMGQNQTCLPFTTTVTNASIQRLAQPQVIAAEQKKPMQTKAKLRSHALQIIHPITNKNILQDLNKDPHKTSNTTMELNKLRTSASSTQIIDRKPTVSKSVEIMQNIKITASKKIYKDATQQAEQKSIVSAMTNYSTAEISANTTNSPVGAVVNTKIENSPTANNLTATKSEVLANAGETLAEQTVSPQQQVIVQNEENKDIELNTASSDNDIEIVDLPVTEERSETVVTEALKQKLPETLTANENKPISHYATNNVTNEIKPLETESKDENYTTIVEDLDLQSELSIADVTENDEDIEISSQTDLENVPGNEPPFAMCSKNIESTTQVTFFNDTFQQSFSDFAEIHDASLSPTNRRQQYTRKQLMQLRQAKNSCVQPDVKNTCIFAPISLMPAFVTRGNKKLPATVTGHRGGPCTSSNNQNKAKQNLVLNQGSVTTNAGAIGQSAAAGSGNRVPNKPIIYLNLSLNQDVKLNEADNAWRPRVLVKACDTLNSNPEQQDAPEKHELLRRVRGILNKLTPENFEPLVEEIIKLKIDTLEKMEAVMNLVFEKAIDEPNFSVSYAKLCHRLISEVKARDERMESSTKSNLAFFRNALLDKTESEFTHNVIKINAKEEKLKPIRERLTICQDNNEKIELEALLIEEERKIRRRSGGTVRFIGELFKISILSGKIINSCIEALLKYPNNEDMLECLCKLLTTVGQKFEQTPMFTDDKSKYSLKTVIQRMQKIASKTGNSKISSRVRFMLLDVIDLRKKKWQSTRNEAPKTMEQIEKEGNASQQGSSTSNGTKRDEQKRQQGGGSGGGGGGGLQTQLTSQTNYTATPTNTVLDSNKPVKLESHATNKRNERGRCSISADAAYTQRDNMGAAKYTDGGKNSNDSKWQVQTGKVNCSQAVDTSKLVGLTKVDLNNKKMGGVSLFQWKKLYTPPAAGTAQQTSNSFEVLSLEANKGNKLEHDHDKMRSNSRLKTTQLNKIGNEHERYTHDQHNRQHSQTLNKDNQRKPPILRGQQQMRTQKSGGNQSKYQQDMMNPSRNPPKFLQLHKAPNVMGNSDAKQYATIITPPAIFIEPTEVHLKLIKPVVTEMLENAADTKHIDSSTVSCISKLPDNLRCSLIYYLLTDYLHLANVKSLQRRYLANIVGYLIEKRYITKEHFNMAYKKFAELASDLIVDIPQLWLYIFEFTGPLMVKHILSVNDLWSQELRESGPPDFGRKFLKSFLLYSTREIGPNFIRNTWHKYHMKWSDYMDESQIEDFIKNNAFDYVENENKPPLTGDSDKEPPDIRNKRIGNRIQQMLNEGANPDQIIDFINGNIKDVNKPFIHNLTNTLTNFAIEDLNNYSLDVHCFQRICIPVLRRYLDSKDDLELECLRAIELLIHDLEHPKDLLQTIYYELSDADVIAQETFLAWQDLKKQCEKCSTANL